MGKKYHRLQSICCIGMNFSCPWISDRDESSGAEQEINQEQVPAKVRSTADKVILTLGEMSGPQSSDSLFTKLSKYGDTILKLLT